MHENRVEEPQASPTLLEDGLQKSREFMEGIIAERTKDSFERALDWSLVEAASC